MNDQTLFLTQYYVIELLKDSRFTEKVKSLLSVVNREWGNKSEHFHINVRD